MCEWSWVIAGFSWVIYSKKGEIQLPLLSFTVNQMHTLISPPHKISRGWNWYLFEKDMQNLKITGFPVLFRYFRGMYRYFLLMASHLRLVLRICFGISTRISNWCQQISANSIDFQNRVYPVPTPSIGLSSGIEQDTESELIRYSVAHLDPQLQV